MTHLSISQNNTNNGLPEEGWGGDGVNRSPRCLLPFKGECKHHADWPEKQLNYKLHFSYLKINPHAWGLLRHPMYLYCALAGAISTICLSLRVRYAQVGLCQGLCASRLAAFSHCSVAPTKGLSSILAAQISFRALFAGVIKIITNKLLQSRGLA